MDFTQDFKRSKDFLTDENRDFQQKSRIFIDLLKSFEESFNQIDLNSNFLHEYKKTLELQKNQQDNKKRVKEMMLVNQIKYHESLKANDEKLIKMQNEVEGLKEKIIESKNKRSQINCEKALKELELDEKRSFFNEYFQQETELNEAVESIRAKRQEILISKNTAISQKQEDELRQLDLSTSHFEIDKDRNKEVLSKSINPTPATPSKLPIESLLTLLLILVSLLFFLS
jgi:hypothetical protein